MRPISMPGGKHWSEIWRDQGDERHQRRHDQDREHEQRRVPARACSPLSHPRKKAPKTAFPVHDAGHCDSGNAGRDKHRQSQEHHIGELKVLRPGGISGQRLPDCRSRQSRKPG